MNSSVSKLLALLPLLSIYATGISGISLADLFVLIFGLIVILKRKVFKPYFLSYVLYAIFITLFASTLGYNNLALSARTIISFLMFFVFFNIVPYIGNKKQVVKSLLFVGNLCCVFFIIQYLVLYTSGYVVPGVLPFLPLANEANTEEFLGSLASRDRLSSFFTEPAHFCEFLIIVLTLRLFLKKNDSKNIAIALIYTLCIYLSKSAIGFVSGVFIWVVWLLKVTQLWKKNKFACLIFAFCIISLSLPLLSSIGDDSILNRFTQISFTPEVSSHGFSSYIRVLRGYIPFFESNIFVKLFGSGLGAIYTFVNNNPNSVFLLYVDYLIDYLNSIQYVLFYTGVVGFVLLFRQFKELYSKTSEVGRVLLLVSSLQMLGAGYMFSMNFILVIYLVINTINHDINNYSNL